MSDDGLTDQERRELADRYVTTGAGRPMDDKARAAVTDWLENRPNYVSRKPSEPFSNADEGKVDLVNNPPHYNAYKGLEVIDLTEQLNFNRGNTVKYVARAGLKNPDTELEDLRKAAWYLQREIDRIQRI